MTPELSFECLLVSRDARVLTCVNRILQELSVSTKICLHPSKAADALAAGGTDLVVLDFEDESCLDLLQDIWKTGLKQRPTVLAITHADCLIPGAHISVNKPLTPESGTKALKDAYSRMLRDYRRHARCALMIPVTATDERGQPIPMTVLDVGYGGVGLRVRSEVEVGESLSFALSLPGAKRAIHIEARVLWTRSFGTIGCEFLRIPPVDLNLLHDWLMGKIRVKTPLVKV